MVSTTYDHVNSVKIGYDAGHCTTITELVYYADRIETPHSEGELEPIEVINLVKPSGVSGRHKHWIMIVAVESTEREGLYTQQTEVGDAAARALKDSLDNSTIEYFVVELEKDSGAAVTLTFESGKVACIGEVSRFSNREDVEYQITEYVFICWGNRT